MGKKLFSPSDCFILGSDILGQKIFFTMFTLWVSKDAEFYIDFKNINLLK
jgi:hypothetical protein